MYSILMNNKNFLMFFLTFSFFFLLSSCMLKNGHYFLKKDNTGNSKFIFEGKNKTGKKKEKNKYYLKLL